MNHTVLSDLQLDLLIATIQDSAERTEYPNVDNPPPEIVLAFQLASRLRLHKRKNIINRDKDDLFRHWFDHHAIYLGHDDILLAIDIIFTNLSFDDMELTNLESLNRHKTLSQIIQKLTNINQATSWGTDMGD